MNKRIKEESGITLVESMLAILIMLVGLLTMAQVLTLSVVASKTFGRDAGKTTAFARVQMEQLAGLPFASPQLTAGTYNDALNLDGTINTTGSPAFTRNWEVTDLGNIKRIVVSVTSTKSFKFGEPPSTTMVTEISN